MNSIYVVNVWSGQRLHHQEQDYDDDRTIYLRAHVATLRNLSHHIDKVVIVVPDNPDEPAEFTEYLQSLEFEVFRRPNVGVSYGGYSDVYQKYQGQYKYWFFTEDDYIYVVDDFDKLSIDLLLEKQVGFLCTMARWGYMEFNPRVVLHAAISNGIATDESLAKINEAFGELPNSHAREDISYDDDVVKKWGGPQVGQVMFSNAFVELGLGLDDISDRYSQIYFDFLGYLRPFDDTHPHLILPYQYVRDYWSGNKELVLNGT